MATKLTFDFVDNETIIDKEIMDAVQDAINQNIDDIAAIPVEVATTSVQVQATGNQQLNMVSTEKDVKIEAVKKDVVLVADEGDIKMVAPGKGIEEPISLTQIALKVGNESSGLVKAVADLQTDVNGVETELSNING